jgi:hypothetical protein
MRLLSAIGIAVLSLTIVAPVYAQEQHDQKEEEKAKPEQEKEKKVQPEKPAKPAERSAQEEKNTQLQDKNNKPEEKSAQQHAQPAQHASGGRIPDDRYRANFGREHSFRVSEGDYRNHRFQYGGYWFGFVGGWPSNWLYTQDVYVMEINGVYYLCNPTYPGVNVALEVTL